MTSHASELKLEQFKLLESVRHGVSNRHGGVSDCPYASLNLGFNTADSESRIIANRILFCDQLEITPDCVVQGHLTHGNRVSVFSRAHPKAWPLEHLPARSGSDQILTMFDSDAAVSDVPRLNLVVTAADCVPILFLDKEVGVVGIAHAGWRGTAMGIAGEVIRTMVSAFGSDPKDVVTAIGPSIGPCCYDIGSDVVGVFRTHEREPVLTHDGGLRLDLWSTNQRQLESLGVPSDSIEISRICTSCRVDSFYSHRAERGISGRFAACIGLS